MLGDYINKPGTNGDRPGSTRTDGDPQPTPARGTTITSRDPGQAASAAVTVGSRALASDCRSGGGRLGRLRSRSQPNSRVIQALASDGPLATDFGFVSVHTEIIRRNLLALQVPVQEMLY
jgi:hypothetical protein